MVDFYTGKSRITDYCGNYCGMFHYTADKAK
jgi:hypothetical protein